MAGVARAQLALSTGTVYNLGLERVFQLAAGAGYDGIELLVDARRDTYDVAYLEQLSERVGLPILSVHTPFMARVDGWPGDSQGRVEQAIRLAQDLGAGMVVAHAPLCWHVLRLHLQGALGERWLQWVLPWRDRAEGRFGEWLEKEVPLIEVQSGVQVAVENMPCMRCCGRRIAAHGTATAAAMQRWRRVVLDTTHWGTWGVDPLVAYRELRGRVAHVHLSDYDGREHRVPYKGCLGLERLLAALAEDGFGGTVVVELDPWAVAEGDWSDAHLERVLGETAARVRAPLGPIPSHSDRDRVANADLSSR